MKISTLLLILLSFLSSPLLAKQAVIIDTDLGYDDWDAILVAMSNPEIKLEAISIVATGEVHANPGIDSTLRFLDALDFYNIPVAVGDEEPLDAKYPFPQTLRIHADSLLSLISEETFLIPARTHRKPSAQHAVEMLYELIKSRNEPTTLLAIGPLTNIAQLITKHPDIQQKISSLIIMGGAVYEAGNLFIPHIFETPINHTAEWNIAADAHAAKIVFSAPIRKLLVPVDATNSTEVSNQLVTDLTGHPNFKTSKKLQILHAILKEQLRLQPDKETLYFWDLAAALFLDNLSPEFATVKTVNISVEDNLINKNSFAATQAAPCPTKAANCTQVVTHIDNALFNKTLESTLRSL